MTNQRVIAYIPPSQGEISLFNQGKHFTSYNFLGAHRVKYLDREGINFTLWAPNAKEVRIIGDFNAWQGKGFEMQNVQSSGIWTIFISELKEEDLYKYELITQQGEIKRKADPYGFYSEVRPNTASKIFSLNSYPWQDGEYMKNKQPPYDQPLNIYELHLGSWKRKDKGEFITYREAAEEVIPYVVQMGYTHIELLPLMEHPFDGSWGYQITGYFSVTSRYGHPNDFKYFVEQCHLQGIGVILDWVPGHFCKDEHGLYQLDGSPLYEHHDLGLSQNHQWGTAVFDFEKPQVRSFLISNAVFWFERYHIDGLRVDAVSYMLYLDQGREGKNLAAIDFLKTLNKVIFHHYPEALMIAEDSSAWPLVTAPVHFGGLGFNYKWNMGWMNDILKYMQKRPESRKEYHQLITFSITYTFSENFLLPLSHDEVVHGKKSLLDKMPGDYWQKFAGLRLLYSYMYAHPGKKLLFMGGEFGQFIEWDHDKELDWFLLDYDMHKKMQSFVKTLNHFYKAEKTLYQWDHKAEGFQWINHQDHEQSVFSFIRRNKEGDFLLGIFNFTPTPYRQYKMGIPERGIYKEVLNSDDEKFGGSHWINKGEIKSIEGEWHNCPHYIELSIPPLGAIYMKKHKFLDKDSNYEGVIYNEKTKKRNCSDAISRGTGN
ncbi:1,4-alpha-glucan branching protein GlgB [Irregularibacter muris]|uniref:1,4-alpha-glucan branching enzyme GlgB n=1 Tax=Irregularibacter muris TaxID=1796619 RepID=A0AAE3HGF0_9FIRM|nr:1,4-alpha-glucan branching protein GlgB [Irregularibacter muris]MCR1898970.1 1,4-alpha-glucan branching protein GlgB [Irregularibacter muris]